MNRNLSNQTRGLFGGPRGLKGQYILGNIGKNSGGVLGQASTVNGNALTVRKIIGSGKIKS